MKAPFQPSRPARALPFLGLVPGLAFLMKNATLWNGYLALSAYGWPRVYRRVLEHTRKHMPEAERARVNASIKQAIRVPGQATTILTESHVGRFLQNYVDRAVGEKPSLVVVFARTLLDRTAFGKVKKVMDNSKRAK